MDNAFSLPLLAGALATVLFTTSQLPMLVRAYTTKDLRSYSRTQLVLSTAGNGVYWLYISTLPVGPIWLLHTFHTITTALMLGWYLRYGAASPGADDATRLPSHPTAARWTRSIFVYLHSKRKHTQGIIR